MRTVLTFEREFNGYNIQNTQQGAIIGILDKSHNLLTMMLEKHSQVLIHGYCCTYPNDGMERDFSNQTFLTFLQKFTDHLRHQKYAPSFLWCREQTNRLKPHWHFTLFLNANKVRFLDNTYASNLWNQILNCNNYGCLQQTELGGKKRGMIIKREDKIAFNEAIYKMSYLAKQETKTYIPANIRQYGGSQLT